MLQTLDTHIRYCLEQATEAKREAERAIDPQRKSLLLHYADAWDWLARSYQLSAELEHSIPRATELAGH